MMWHQLELAAVARELRTDLNTGLSGAAAAERLAEYGPNELTGSGVRSPWRILWEQFSALMVVILIAAAAISALLGDDKDAIAIGAIVALNAALGFSQEYRAEKAMAALKKFAAPSVKVRRHGEVRELKASLLVPGDLMVLEAGNTVAADCRLVESASLEAHEAILTGESHPIAKITAAIPETELALGDRRNMLYMGTFVTAGRGQAIVTETGMRSEIGRIAGLIQTVAPEPTPLQRRLQQLGKGLAAAALAIVAIIFLLGWLRGEDLKLLFLTAVSLGVAAVPEGLPAVVTIALTLGAQRMLRRNVLIRKLPAVETLGSVTVICSDKTGTLTQNRMTVASVQLANESVALSPEREPINDVSPNVRLLFAGAALCNDSIVQQASELGAPAPLGDPTETALVVAAGRFGLMKPDLDRTCPRVAEIPFSSERKCMTTVHRMPSAPAGFELPNSAYAAFTKGAADRLLDLSATVHIDGHPEPLTASWRERLSKINDALAGQGMRVIGVACRGYEVLPKAAEMEQGLAFLGMLGLIDPPRPDAFPAVGKCKAAGIRPVMITGDHPLTARTIAAELGIASDEPIVTGQQLDRLSSGDLRKTSGSTAVYARVSPEHKLKIVQALQQQGEIVAMTGDGVNDAPALKKADIGVGMGITGTDVAKEAADMVLLDDNFASIVAAVEEGRVIYDNIRKFIKYILATNSGEIWVMLVAPLLGMPLPLLPLQILWMNLVTDGLPALALGVEPAESDTMRRPPYPPDETIFARGLGLHVIWVGILMALLALAPAYWLWRIGDANWQSFLFTMLTISQMAHVMAIRSERWSLFRLGFTSNKPLLGAVVLTIVLQAALLYVPFLQTLFRTTALPLSYAALAVLLSSAVFIAVEIEKSILRSGSSARRQNP